MPKTYISSYQLKSRIQIRIRPKKIIPDPQHNYDVEKSSMSTFGYCLPAVAKTAKKWEERDIWKMDKQQEMEEISSIAGYSDAGP